MDERGLEEEGGVTYVMMTCKKANPCSKNQKSFYPLTVVGHWIGNDFGMVSTICCPIWRLFMVNFYYFWKKWTLNRD